jgi:phenylacetate-CoA ligase
MFTWLSKCVFNPLWDIKDRSVRLRTLRALMRTQWLSLDEHRIRQNEKLKLILSYAYENCEYYKSLFDQHDIRPDQPSILDEFWRVPILTKRIIQEQGDMLISRKYDKSRLVSAKTGGSTGKALQIYFDKRWQEIRSADALRSNRWANWDIGMKVAAVWGNPPVMTTWTDKIRNWLLDRTIYLDTMNLSAQTMADFISSWREYRPAILFGHAHSLFILAKFLREQQIGDIRPSGIVSSSMMLIDSEREVIETVFKCKVTNRYGCEEVGLIASECEQHNGMHLNIEHLFIEFLTEDGLPVKDGEDGQIVVTDLTNRGMPLIRYRVEDAGAPSTRMCPCGRGFPMMERVTGRIADFLVKQDGSLVAGVSLVERTLTAIKGIEQMQIIQERVDLIRINMVTREGYGASSEAELLTELRQVFGDKVQLDLNYVDGISQERSGKYRFSICKV